MRKLIILIFFIPVLTVSLAQSNGTLNENKSPLNNRPATFEEYLVQLALINSPEAEGGKYEVEVRKQEIELAKKDWTRNLTTGLNFNDVSFPYFLVNTVGVEKIFGRQIDLTKLPTVATYPLWQIGIGVNVGDIFVRKHKVKAAESRRKISEMDLNLVKQKIKAEVLKRYQEYLVSIEILKVRLQSLDAAEANKIQISNLFSVNKASFQDFNESNKTFTDALEAKIKAESDIKIRKIAIEELTGVKWETVEKIKLTYDFKK